MMEQEEQKSRLSGMFGGDKVLWVILAILAMVSLFVVYSSTASMAYRKLGGDTAHYFISQLFFVCLGFIVAYTVHRFNYQTYARYSQLLFLLAVGLSLLTFFIGVDLNDAQRWIRVPGIGVTFQPSDFLKVTLVMVLARQLARRQKTIDKSSLLPHFFRSKKSKETNRDILFDTTIPLLLPIGIACSIIFVSNFSTAAITFMTCMIMLFIGRVKIREILKLLSITVGAVVVLVTIMSAADIGRAKTWTNRVKSYVGVVDDNQTEKSKEDNLQREQAEIAIASGWGVIGKGPGNSTQRANLPHSYSDFAYAFIIEEYGTIFATLILVLYLWIFFRAITIFQKCGTAFPSLLVLGIALLIVMQALTNILVSVGLFPVTGQPLPIISRGGSSLLFTSFAMGMILGVSRQIDEQTIDTPKEESLLEKN